MALWIFILPFALFVLTSCNSVAANPSSPALARVFATPTPPNPCALAPLPDRTPIVRPTFTPLPPQTPMVSGNSVLIDTTFNSESLGRTMPILVYLPPGYAESQLRYPTLYMLGGYSGEYREWMYWGICLVLDRMIRNGTIQPMIVVMPEGERSYWFNHAPVANSDGKPWGDYIWKDVVNFVDSNFRTMPRREKRAIGGLSAGGQGALMLALTHPEVFSIAGAHSPSMRSADGSIEYFGDQEYFKQYYPVWLIEHTQSWKQLTLWIDVGHDDAQWGGVVVEFHRWLDTLGVPHDFVDQWKGVHDDAYWSAHLPDYLQWYSAKLSRESN